MKKIFFLLLASLFFQWVNANGFSAAIAAHAVAKESPCQKKIATVQDAHFDQTHAFLYFHPFRESRHHSSGFSLAESDVTSVVYKPGTKKKQTVLFCPYAIRDYNADDVGNASTTTAQIPLCFYLATYNASSYLYYCTFLI